jgi:hypothetical protein
MVQSASSSKSNSNHSKAKSTAFKVGPPTKKRDAVSMAKAKTTKQQSIKKHTYTGKINFVERLRV